MTRPAFRLPRVLMYLSLALGLAAVVAAPPMPKWTQGPPRLYVAGGLSLIALAIAASSKARGTFLFYHQLLHRSKSGGRRQLALVIGIFAAGYFVAAAFANERPLVPRLFAEKSQVVQAHLAARGTLWRPPHPLGESFETFDMLSSPVWTSSHFPGAALMYAPGILIGAPEYLTSILISACVVGLVGLITMELLDGDGMAGIIAALLMMSVDSVHDLSTWILPHMPALLCITFMVYAHLRWRIGGNLGWAIGMGVAAGWGLITRPVDVLFYLVPIIVLIGLDLREHLPHPKRWTSGRQLIIAMLVIVPFVALQVYIDRQVTGRPSLTPQQAYINQNEPGRSTSGVLSSAQPNTKLQQKIDYYNQVIRPAIERLSPRWAALRIFIHERLAILIHHSIGTVLALLFLPAGLVALYFDRRMLVPAVAVLLLVALSPPIVLFDWYDAIMIAPAATALIICGSVWLGRWSGSPFFAALCLLLPAALALSSIPEICGNWQADQPTTPVAAAEEIIDHSVQSPALIFFKYQSNKCSIEEEPVYPLQSGWPDDESIIRAHDLGDEQNAKVIRYFAAQSNSRHVYMLDRSTGKLDDRGSIQSLAGGTSISTRPSQP